MFWSLAGLPGWINVNRIDVCTLLWQENTNICQLFPCCFCPFNRFISKTPIPSLHYWIISPSLSFHPHYKRNVILGNRINCSAAMESRQEREREGRSGSYAGGEEEILGKNTKAALGRIKAQVERKVKAQHCNRRMIICLPALKLTRIYSCSSGLKLKQSDSSNSSFIWSKMITELTVGISQKN